MKVLSIGGQEKKSNNRGKKSGKITFILEMHLACEKDRQQQLMIVQPGRMLQGSPKKRDSRMAIDSTRLT